MIGRFFCCYLVNQNQINFFHYTCCISPKRETSVQAHLCVIAPSAAQLITKKSSSGGEPLATLNVLDLMGPRFEPEASRSRDERVTARPTDYLENKVV